LLSSFYFFGGADRYKHEEGLGNMMHQANVFSRNFDVVDSAVCCYSLETVNRLVWYHKLCTETV